MALIIQMSLKDEEVKKIIEKYGSLENFKKIIKEKLLSGEENGNE